MSLQIASTELTSYPLKITSDIIEDIGRHEAIAVPVPEVGSGVGELAESLLKLLQTATKEVDKDREAAKAFIARASSLLRVELGRSSVEIPSKASGGLAAWQMKKVKDYIEDHLEETIRVEQLSQLVRLSATHFARSFNRSFGEPPHEYVTRRRLALACHLMLVTDSELSKIAVACGFADQAHFCRRFRQGMGTSPAAWRRERSEG